MRRLHAFLFASSIVPVAATALACGGKVTFVEDGSGAGGGGTSSSSKATTGTSTQAATTSTGVSCASLKAALDTANAAAQACNPTVSSIQCDGSEILIDACDCPSLLANEKEPAKVAAAKDAFDAWVSAGCGPLPCGGACFQAGPGFCQPNADGSGICVSAVFLD